MRPVFKRDSQPGAGTTQTGNTTNAQQHTQSSPSTSSLATKPATEENLSLSSKTVSSSQPNETQNIDKPSAAIRQQDAGAGDSSIQSVHPLSSANAKEATQKVAKSTSIFSGFGIGLGSGTDPSKSESSGADTATSSAASTLQIKDQTSLEMLWRKVANNILAVDKVVSTRMESIVPKLLNESTIEIEYANQNVESFFKENMSIILNGFKQELGEGKLDIVLKKGENNGPQKILSSYEQLEKMTEINPALKKLKDTLELVLE